MVCFSFEYFFKTEVNIPLNTISVMQKHSFPPQISTPKLLRPCFGINIDMVYSACD